MHAPKKYARDLPPPAERCFAGFAAAQRTVSVDPESSLFRQGFRTKGTGRMVDTRWQPIVPPKHAETVFGLFDAPGSHLDEALEQKIRETFNKFDKDGSGGLDSLELTAALRSMDMYQNQKQVREMLAEIDADHSGTVELRELLAFFRRHGEQTRPQTPSVADAQLIVDLVCKDEAIDYDAISKMLEESGLDSVDPREVFDGEAETGAGPTADSLKHFLSPSTSRSASTETKRPPAPRDTDRGDAKKELRAAFRATRLASGI